MNRRTLIRLLVNHMSQSSLSDTGDYVITCGAGSCGRTFHNMDEWAMHVTDVIYPR